MTANVDGVNLWRSIGRGRGRGRIPTADGSLPPVEQVQMVVGPQVSFNINHPDVGYEQHRRKSSESDIDDGRPSPDISGSSTDSYQTADPVDSDEETTSEEDTDDDVSVSGFEGTSVVGSSSSASSVCTNEFLNSPRESDRVGKQTPTEDAKFPRYLEFPTLNINAIPKPTERLKKLEHAEVRLLRRTDHNKCHFQVAFQDERSSIRYQQLVKKMAGFYCTREGWQFRKPGHSLSVGEVVAGHVNDPSGMFRIRRVKILKLKLEKDREKFVAYCVDIDSLAYWTITTAYCLLPGFQNHPVQVCNLQVTNFESICPKGVFEDFFSNKLEFRKVMSTVKETVLSQLIGQSIWITDIRTLGKDDLDSFSGTWDLSMQLNLKDLFMEAFASYFTPVTPVEGVVCRGFLTHVCSNGTIGLCLQRYLYRPITSILNGITMHRLAESVTSEDTMELIEKIKCLNCQVCIAQLEENGAVTFHRVKVEKYSNPEGIKVYFMERGESRILKFEDLVCSVVGNSRVNPLLAIIPAQALTFKVADFSLLTEEECSSLLKHYKDQVQFVVTGERSSLDNMPIVKLLENLY